MGAKLFKKKGSNYSNGDIELHEIILDKLTKKKEEQWGFSSGSIELPLMKKILQAFFISSALILFLLFLRTFQLQVTQGDDFLAQANQNKYILYKIQAERGVIYDKNLKQLVFNLPSFDLICETNKLPDSDFGKMTVLSEVSRILEVEYEELENKIKEDGDPTVLISENLDHQTLIVLETKIEELPGFKIKETVIRDYKDGETLSHLIGYTGKIKEEELEEAPDFYSIADFVGRTGIEKFYEESLRKKPGEARVERDALGHILSSEIVSFPESGESLVLWLDYGLQKKTKEVLENQLQLLGSKKAIAVAMDPKTGGIMSLVSIPSFDNNAFSTGDSEGIREILNNKDSPLFNRVISGRYPTGSIIKPLTAVAALEEGIINPNKQINCRGGIEVQDFWNPENIWEYKDWRTHGWTDMRKALAESCNVYFYQIGGGYKGQEGLGPIRIKEYLELFGWGEKTQIDLPSEAKGFIPDKEWKKETWGEGWWDGDTYLLSIGQGYLLITPLEVVTAFSSIANGGTLLQPSIVKEIISFSEGKMNTLEKIETNIIRSGFVDPENLQIVKEGMRQAVTGKNSPHASCVMLNSLPVSSAAKTGTAETPLENIYHNWVTVFAPYEDPEIVLTIMIEDVEGVRAAAVPVAKEILEWYFSE